MHEVYVYINEKVIAATKQSSKDVDGKLRRRRRIRAGHIERYTRIHFIHKSRFVASAVGMARIAK